MFTTEDLFEARTGGYHVYRIPGLVVTPQGSVLAHTEARKGRGGDWDPIDIVMRRSTDGGSSWSEPYCVVDHRNFGGNAPINNFVCISDRITGRIEVLFCHDYARVFSMHSHDDGCTFSDPKDVTAVFETFRDRYPWEVVAVGPGHGIQLDSGRLVVPVWMSDGTSQEFGPDKRGHRPSEVGVVVSDDHGTTWQSADIVVRNEPRFRHPNETCVVQLGNGDVLFNVRSESHTHRRLVTTSPNGCTNWSEPQFDHDLVEPICFGSLIGFDHAGRRHIVFANPGVLERSMPGGPKDRGIGPDETGRIYDRKFLTVRLSTDDCRSWQASRRVENGPSGYSDLAALADGTLLCLYECGLKERMFDDRYLRLARFDLDWLAGG